MKKIQVNVRADEDLVERLRNLSWATGIPVNTIIEEGLEKEVIKREKEYVKDKGKEVPTRPKP